MIPSALFKTFILLACTFLGLICGTLYLYSSYSPQLALRLQYSATDASSIALIGSLGAASSGPISGLVVDRKGYTPPLLIGGCCIVVGYFCLRQQFIGPYPNLPLLCFCLYLVGAGSTFINLVCLKCCAVSFPSMRGVATSLPLALYGLLAMFYSVIASIFYPGDTVGFLKFLILSLMVIFALCSPTIMLSDRRGHPPAGRTVRLADPIELQNLRAAIEPKEPVASTPHREHLHGFALLKTYKFWLLFFITGSLASLGQMYIYSVGYMAKALIVKSFLLGSETFDATKVEILIQNQQQMQVGLLSITNCVGRLVAGIMGDIVTQTFHKPRARLLFVPALGLLCTQLMGHAITQHTDLRLVSMLSGFFYGYCFCIMPIIVGDTFGMESFSGNWGLVALAPVAPSFYLTNLFGKVYDLNSVADAQGISSCVLGNLCYNLVFRLSLLVSLFALLAVCAFNYSEQWTASKLRAEKRHVMPN